ASEAKGVASAAGEKAAKDDSKADSQADKATGVAKSQSGEGDLKVGKSANADSEGDGGDAVSVGAALGLNVAWSEAHARVGAVTIEAGGQFKLESQNNMDAAALADGSASLGKEFVDDEGKPAGTTVGIGIAINVAQMENVAEIEAGAKVSAQGASVQALMKDVGGDKTHRFGANAVSGASGGDTGVAGSFALNYAEMETEAELAAGALLNAGGGDVTINAVSASQSDVKATANAAAGGTGVGVSIGLNLIGDASTSALLNGTLGGGNNVTLAAAGSHDLSTVA